MLISIFEVLWVISIVVSILADVGNNIFANSLMGTTVQDGGMRERSNDYIMLFYLSSK